MWKKVNSGLQSGMDNGKMRNGKWKEKNGKRNKKKKWKQRDENRKKKRF